MNENGKEVNKHYPNREDVYRYALAYQAKGLAPIPLRFQGCVEDADKEIRDKLDSQNEIPLISLEEYLKAYGASPPSDEVLRKWFIEDNKNGYRNIGIVTGRASDNLVVIDIVGEDIYKESIEGIKRVLEWRDISTWVIGNGRRFHIYFRIPNAGSEDLRTYTLFSDGDKSISIRGDNSYIIAPPSIGGDCSEYKPLVDLGTTEIAVIDRDVWRRVVDVLEFIAIPVRIPMDLVRERNIPRIATILADEFKRRYYAKYFLVEDIDIGLMCWDGKRYSRCVNKAHEFLEHYYRYNELDKYRIRRNALAKEYMYALEHSSHSELRYERLMISFNNVVLDWERLLDGDLINAFRPHDPNTIVFHYIPHDINIDLIKDVVRGLEKYGIFMGIDRNEFEKLAIKYTPRTYEAFRFWVGDKWILLYEIIGCILYPSPIKKAFLLIGDTDTGKSTYLNLIEALVGRDNVSNIKLQHLTDPKEEFMKASIYRKLVNIYADLPSEALKNIGDFKVLTGGDTVPIRRLYKEAFMWKPYVKFIFSANKPPMVRDADEAFWNRWIVIEFVNKIPKERRIPKFHLKLLPEASNILALSIIAFYNVYRRNEVFSYEDTPEDSRIKWMARSDLVFAWIYAKRAEGKLKIDPRIRRTSSELYEKFLRWCDKMDIPVEERPPQNIFTSRLKAYGYKTIVDGGRTVFIGIDVEEE